MQVALTFDAEHPDRPTDSPAGCTGVLDALAAAGAPGTFFVQGRWALARPAEARRVAVEGHLVALHCHSHVPYTRLSAAGVAADLAEGREAVGEACGVDPAPWFRFPYGEGSDDPALAGQVRAAGFTHVHWSADSRDWCTCVRPDGLADAVVAAVGRRSGAVGGRGGASVVLHHTWPAATAAALPAIVGRLRADGAEFVTVDRLAPAELDALPESPDSGGRGACVCENPVELVAG